MLDHSSDTDQSRAIQVAVIGAAVAFIGIRLLKVHLIGGGFDSSMIANVLWRLAHGFDSQSAMTGAHYVATHASPILVPFLPIFRWVPQMGMPAMYTAQAASVVLVGWAGYLVARHVDLPPRTQQWLLAALLVSPAAMLATQFEFNETTLGLGPLAMVLALSVRGDRAAAILPWLLVALSCRLEMAAAVLLGGLVVWSIGRTRQARTIVALSVPAVGAYAVWLASNPFRAISIEAHFAHLGATPREVVATAFEEPWRLLEPIINPILLVSLLFWLLPFGVLAPLRRARWLLVALPTAAIPVFGVWEPADALIAHYWYPLLAAGTVATPLAVVASDWLNSRLRFWLAAGVVTGWFLLTPFLAFVGDAPAIGAAERAMVGAVRELDPFFASVPAPLSHMLVDTPLLAPYPRPFSCAEEALGPYLAPATPPDVIVIPLAWESLDTAEAHGLDKLLSAYELLMSSDDYQAWRVVDLVEAKDLYLPCSEDTFTPAR